MKIWRKINVEKFSIQPSLFSTLFLFQPFSFFLSAPHLFLFLFLFSLLLFCSSPFFLFFWCVALSFSAQNTSFSGQTFFSPKRFCFSQKLFFFFFSVQPLFSSSFFLLYSFLVQPSFFFLFQHFLFFFSLAPFIQDPIFSLAASHLFYLNKSLFSSNLE